MYLEAITEMPMANLEKISNPSLWWEVKTKQTHDFTIIKPAV
jgi:hypothetical protein